MRLLKIFHTAHFPTLKLRRRHLCLRPRGQIAKNILTLTQNFRMIHRSGRRQNHLIGAIMLTDKLRQVRFLKVSHPLLWP